MKIHIKVQNLIDFPYEARYHSLFYFDEEKMQGLVSEILYAQPTCYLVSGYRGSGKTSFIKRAQERCLEENLKNPNLKKVIFVHSNFSRYENRTYFLRRIIRDLKKTVHDLHTAEDSQLVESLFKKTFYDVKNEYASSTEKEHSYEISTDIIDALKSIGKIILPLTIPLFTELVSPSITNPLVHGIVKFGGYIVGGLATIFSLFKVSYKYAVKKSKVWKNSETSMTDDDIINYYLEDLLDKFTERGRRIVFVLDELDKIDPAELNILLNEMKPWLVKGVANFVLVAGQRLTMKYYRERKSDDAILT